MEMNIGDLFFLRLNPLHVEIRDDLPSKALAGAFGNSIVLSKNLIQMVENGRISKPSFSFIFFHEFAHVLQQTVLSKKLLKDKMTKFIDSNREFLELEANEMALSFISSGLWEKVASLIKSPKAQENIQFYDYSNLPVQWWMVDGILSEALLTENPEKGGKADDLKKNIRAAIDSAKNDEKLNNLLGVKEGSEYSNLVFDVQAAALEEGIHETYARDALTEFESNCNKHIDPKSKARGIQVKLKREDNGWKYYLVEKNGEVVHKINRESVVQGSQWNDRWHYSNIRFGLKFCIAEHIEGIKDAFIYSSHLKRMQFLHSMDCSGGSRVFNYLKIRRWVEFCIDVFNDIEIVPPGKHIQEMTLDEYVYTIDDKLFRIMMRDLHDSKYGHMTIKSFFAGNKYDAGSIALGVVAHMIQDSFALSHAKRCLDPFALRLVPEDMSVNAPKEKTKDMSIDNDLDEAASEDLKGNPVQVEKCNLKSYKENVKKEKSTWNYEEFRESLARQAMPIILYANYEKQHSDKHKHADIFLTHIDCNNVKATVGRVIQWLSDNKKTDEILFDDFYKQTLNATMARDCSEMFIYMASMDYPKEDILKFLDSIYPFFDVVGKTTDYGMQYCLKNTVDHYYETIVESMMCYNFNEALINRVLTFNRVLVLLEGVINRTPKNAIEQRKECFSHICEIINEIICWAYLLVRGLENDKSSRVSSHCAECARSVAPLMTKINKILGVFKKRGDCLDDKRLEHCKRLLDNLLNNTTISDDDRAKIKEHFKDWKLIFNDLKAEDWKTKCPMEKCFVFHVITGDVLYAGTDANIYLEFYGKKEGDQAEIFIGKCPLIDNICNSFERCSDEIFEFYTDLDIVEMTRIVIGHDGKWCGDGWFIKDIIVSSPLDLGRIMNKDESNSSNSNKGGWIFNVMDWVGKNEELNLPAKSLKKGRYFVIKVYTGNEVCAGTDSDIYITLNDSGAKKLDNGLNNFEIKDFDTFSVEYDFDIGEISKIKLENKGSDVWLVDRVVITDVVSDRTWNFSINQRVEKDRPLTLSQERYCNFEIEVYTSNQSCGGTNNNVSIEIVGMEGSTEKRRLDNSKDNFEQGDKDTFSISSEKSIGQITGINIWKDGIDDWFLDKITIKDIVSGESKTFLANCEVDEELHLPKDNDYYFKIDVYTGDKLRAGTNSNVYISFLNENKKKIQGKEFKLDSSNDDFELEQVDSFFVTTNFSFDDVSYIAIRKDGVDDWFLDKIIVTDTATENKKEYMANTLVKNDDVILPKENENFFIVDVYTSNQWNGGTNNDVFITIFGENGKTERTKLDNAKDNFEQSDKDSFTIYSEKSLGSIKSIVIQKDGCDDWFTDKIIVTNKSTNEEYTFVINKLIKKESAEFFPQVPRQSFIVDVYTGEENDVEGRSLFVDSHVSFTIIGEKGQIEAKPNNSDLNFEDGDKDSFTVVGESCIGDIVKVEVRLDGRNKWFLHKLVFVDIVTSEEWTFYANCWIKDEDVISLEKDRICLKLDIYTKDESGVGGDGDVSIQIYGKNKNEPDSDIDIIASYVKIPCLLKYVDDPKDSDRSIPIYRFHAGSHDAYKIYASSKIKDIEVNGIEKIFIKHDGKRAWGLDKIIITNIATEKIWGVFTADGLIEGNNKEYTIMPKQEHVFKVDFYATDEIKVNNYESWLKMSLLDSNHNELTPFVELNDSEEKFDKGCVYSFIVTAKNTIDAVKYIKLKQQGLHNIYYQKIDMGFQKNAVVCQKIVIADIGEKTVEKIFAVPSEICSDEIYELEEAGNDHYISLDIYTSEFSGSCTHDDVGVSIIGSINVKNQLSGDKSEKRLENVVLFSCNSLDNSQNNYEEGKKDTFVVKADRTKLGLMQNDIFEIDKIADIKISKTNAGDDWHLDRIVATDLTTGKEWIFIANSWVRKETISLSLDKCRHFVVDVYTNGGQRAGTDGSVKISINGKEKALDDRNNNFEAGDKDSFTIHYDEPLKNDSANVEDGWIPDVKIWYSGIDSWKLDLVIIKDLNSDELWVYAPEKNFKGNEWCSLRKCESNSCFFVDIYTSGESGAGTNANVEIAINNEVSKSNFDDGHDNYESGNKDSFIVVYDESIGEPNCITVSHDGSGTNSNWKLGKVVVTDVVDNREWSFLANKNNCWIVANKPIVLKLTDLYEKGD